RAGFAGALAGRMRPDGGRFAQSAAEPGGRRGRGRRGGVCGGTGGSESPVGGRAEDVGGRGGKGGGRGAGARGLARGTEGAARGAERPRSRDTLEPATGCRVLIRAAAEVVRLAGCRSGLPDGACGGAKVPLGKRDLPPTDTRTGRA